MFRYALYSVDGDRLGEAAYAVNIQPGEIIYAFGTQQFRVVAVVPIRDVAKIIDDAGWTPMPTVEGLAGLLQIEPV